MVGKRSVFAVNNTGLFLALFVVVFFVVLLWFFYGYFLPRFRLALEQTFADLLEGDGSFGGGQTNRFSKRDFRDRDKKKERGVLKDGIVDESLELEVVSKALEKKQRPKIVGFGFKILGPFTKRFVDNFLANNRGVDPNQISEKGYYQAHELSKKSGGRSADFSSRL